MYVARYRAAQNFLPHARVGLTVGLFSFFLVGVAGGHLTQQYRLHGSQQGVVRFPLKCRFRCGLNNTPDSDQKLYACCQQE